MLDTTIGSRDGAHVCLCCMCMQVWLDIGHGSCVEVRGHLGCWYLLLWDSLFVVCCCVDKASCSMSFCRFLSPPSISAQSTRVTDACSCAWLCMGVGDSNPGLHAFKASTWHTEPSPQLQHRALCRKRSLPLGTYIVVGVGVDLIQKKIVEGWHPGHGHYAHRCQLHPWPTAFACSTTASAWRSWRLELFPCVHLSCVSLVSPLQGSSALVLYCHLLKHLKGVWSLSPSLLLYPGHYSQVLQ